jgi:hypothetical protein
MADTQRDGRDGRTNGWSADGRDWGRAQGATRVPGRVESPAGWRPGATTPRLFGPRFWLLLLGLLDDLPFLPTGTGPARCGRLQAPRGAPAAIGERFGQAIVRQRPLAMVVTSLRPDGWKWLTARHGSRSRQRGGLTSGRSALSSIFDCASPQSDQIELANLWQAAVEGARPCNRPGAGPGMTCCGAPRRNRTGDPILTIDARMVRNAVHHLAYPRNRAGERRCRGLDREAM